MEDHDISFPAETLLAWIREEHRTRGALQLWPSREYVAIPRSRTDKGSFTEDEDLAETVAVGLLDVQPLGRRAGWTLHVRIEDELAAHLPEDEDAPVEPEAVDFEAFWSEFVVPGRGVMHAWITVESDDGKAAFDRFLRSLEARHARRR